MTRREFLATAATAAAASPLLAANKNIPVGLELYSVRDELHKDLMGTVRAVAKMGYQCVEFFSPYYAWTPDYAKQVRALLDELGITCCSTHNDLQAFSPDKLSRTIDLNHIIGSKIVILASAGRMKTLDDWKSLGGKMTEACEKLRPEGLRSGYHNHLVEFQPIEGHKPLEVLAASTPKDFVLQLDVGHCISTGADPVAWINENPGRIVSMHLKDWSPDSSKAYKVLLGDGVAPWAKIFEAAEKTGGVEYYLIEQEGSDYPALDTAARCLSAFHKLHG